MRKTGACTVLDFEDSAWDPLSEKRTDDLKERARTWYLKLVQGYLHSSDTRDIWVRINGMGSGYYERDIEVVSCAAGMGGTVNVLLPKTESGDMLKQCRSDLGARVGPGVHPRVSPVVETRGGLGNLNDILKALDSVNREVFFGFYDYALDAKQWPFWKQTEPTFWTLVTNLIGKIVKFGGLYVHTPYGRLNDTKGLLLVKANLIDRSPRCVAMSTLNEAQSSALLDERSGLSDEPDVGLDDNMGADDLAHWIVDAYPMCRRNRLSFAVHRKSGRFIPPHEYLAALRHLGALRERAI